MSLTGRLSCAHKPWRSGSDCCAKPPAREGQADPGNTQHKVAPWQQGRTWSTQDIARQRRHTLTPNIKHCTAAHEPVLNPDPVRTIPHSQWKHIWFQTWDKPATISPNNQSLIPDQWFSLYDYSETEPLPFPSKTCLLKQISALLTTGVHN